MRDWLLGFSSLVIVLFSCQTKDEHPEIKKNISDRQ